MLNSAITGDAPAAIANTVDVQILHIYISPGHNFRGHHGREPSAYETIEVESINCVAGKGLEGDRYFEYEGNYKGQITFFDWYVYQSMCDTLGVIDRTPAALRRNVITAGINLNELIGKQFEIQGIQFEGTEECKPCYWMDRAFGPGTEASMQGRGGLRARILTSGALHKKLS